MDSRESVIAALRALNNQACLTALSSVGEYKRACKELENGQPSVSFEDGKFTVTIGGETVTLGRTSENFRCSCPSPVICRHILAAVMAVCAETSREDDGEDKTETENEKDAEAFDKEDIRKLVGERTFRAATQHYAAASVEITCAAPLTAIVNGHKTVFLSGLGGRSVCSCKKSMCEHRAIALLKVLSERTGEGVVADFDLPDANTVKLIDECLSHLAGLLKRGLYAATVVDAQLLMFYSLNLSAYAKALGRNLRSLSLLLGEVLGNRIFTENSRLVYHFCKAYNLLSAVASNAGNADILARILEEEPNVYRTIAEGTFLSLGYYAFLTESGYAGVTHLLAGEEGVFSFGSVLPTVYDDYDEKELAELVKAQCPKLFTSLAGHKVTLSNFKSNGVRINLTPESTVRDLGAAAGDIPSLDAYEFNYGALSQSGMTRDYFGARALRYAVVPYDALRAELNDYGAAEATLTFDGRSLTAGINLNAVTKSACEVLIAKKRKGGYAVLELYDGEYFLRTLFENGRAVNLYFPEDGKDGKKR